MRWLPHLIAAAGCSLGAYLVTPHPVRSPADLGRPLVAPIMLPFMWSGLVKAIQDGSPEEVVGRGRTLLRLRPTWLDGHLYLAQKMAFDASRRADNADEALDRLLAALALLDEAWAACPAHQLEIRLAQAFLIEFRATTQPELGAAYRQRFAADPLDAAAGYLDGAEEVSGGRHVRTARAYLTMRMVGPALRDGDRARALATLDVALDLLEDVATELRGAGRSSAASNADAHHGALMQLRDHLNGEPGADLDSVLANPLLQELTQSLRPN